MSLRSQSLRSRLVRWSLGSLGSASLLLAAPAAAVNITWIGGNTQWDDGGTTASWNPADEPDSNDAAIFNTNNTITMGTNNVINGLTMSASSELLLNGHALTVDGPTTLSGSGTRLDLTGALSTLDAADVTINSGATLFVDEGAIQSLATGVANSTVTINAGGTFSGNGELSMADSIAAVTTLINNNGTITALNPAVVFIAPGQATLRISAVDADARIDLDGSLEGGVVNVNRNQTLDIDMPLADIFNGNITMAHETKLDIASAWILGAGAVMNVDNGAVGGIPGVAAGKATIAGASFSQNSGAINVLDDDGTLQFDAPLTINGGTLVNNGLVIFNSSTVLGAAAGMTLPTASSSFTVAANRNVVINQNNFNLDGFGVLTNTITVESGGDLTVNTTDYDPDSATNAFNGTINLNRGNIEVITSDAEFVMDGVLNMNSTGAVGAEWDGESIDIGNNAGALSAHLNVTGDGNINSQARFFTNIDFNSDADVNVAAGASLAFNEAVSFDTVNGGNNASFTGGGSMFFSGLINVNEAVTLNMVGGLVDLDGADAFGEFINIDAPMTINVATFANFGRVNAGGGVNTLDVNNNAGTGVLTVNLDNANDEWTLNAPGVMNLANDNAPATLLAGSDVNVNGTVNVTGDVRTTARLDIAGTVNISTAAEPFRLAGGDGASDMNTLAGGTISGSGILAADAGKGLTGHGTINTAIDFDGSADLVASGGTLTLTNFITDVNTIRTSGAAAVFNFTQPVTTNVTDDGILMEGGLIQGAQLTVAANSKPLRGAGIVTNQVVNNGLIEAVGANLMLQTAGNDNDWDGAANSGQLNALSGDLEVRDNATFTFGGTVTAVGDHKVYTKGFGFNFNSSSTLNLTQGTLQADETTTISGTVVVGAGTASTINVQNNRFLDIQTGSSTTLNGNLQLKNNNINIEAGATFSGAGAIIIPSGSHMIADNLADIGVLLDMQGTFRPGGFNTIGRVNLFDYQQASTGLVEVELTGTALNAFDRLVASGDVLLDGSLVIDIDGAFVPALGNTFNIITGNTVTGVFDTIDVSGMPAGLAFHLNYLGNAVQLQVVNKPIFSADFDEDGDVDSTDLAIWKNAFNLNQLGDADGDNDSDGADFLVWQQQFGGKPAVAVSTPAAAAVPEPSGFALLAFAAAGIAAARRRELAKLL
ncbi:beta strand repeat-containing protein [Lacipirellula sp.]|uniref:beta strand repeat-containing protein n=1 Tax=Lacipirellula sp. TaxID=2691419 RepID=UPI003D0FD189